MSPGGFPAPGAKAMRGRRVGLLAPFLACIFLALAWIAFTFMGLMGILMLASGLTAATVVVYLVFRHPIVVCMVWFVTMSGLQTVAMIRMPGLPDLSLTRLAQMLVLLVGAIHAVSGRRLQRPPYGPERLLMVHAAYVLVNMQMAGMDSRFHTWLSSSFAPILGFMYAKYFVSEEKHLRTLMIAFVSLSVYFWVTCVGERFGIDQIVWPKAILNRDIGISWFGRSRGPFLQPGITGQFLGWYMMVQVFLLSRRLSVPVRALLVVNLCLCAFGTFLTYTRGPWLATVVGLLAMVVLRPRYRRFVAVAAVLGALLVAGNAVRPAQDEFLSERLSTTNTIDNRLGFLAAATRMIGANPLFGVGYFRYLDELPNYNHGTYIPLYGYVARGAGKDVPIHDMFIGRAAEEGLVSLALVAWLLVVLWHHFWRRWREATGNSWFDRDFLALYAGVMVSYIVNGMTLDYRYFDFVNVLPMFMSGILIGYHPAPASPVFPAAGSESGRADGASSGLVPSDA
jgi:O-antigen ligase